MSWLKKHSMVVAVTLIAITFITALVTTTDLHAYQNSAVDVWIHVGNIKHNVSRNFLSIALESKFFASGKMLNLTHSAGVIRLAKYLSPGYLRVGGNAADLVIFQENGTKKKFSPLESWTDTNFYDWDIQEGCSFPRPMPPIVMTGEEWVAINRAAEAADLTVVFDLNALLRFPNGRWNSSNAKELLQFSAANNISAVWQLGNEPDAFYHKFGVMVPPRRLGNDFNVLKQLLESVSPGGLLVGPDVTRPKATLLKQDSTEYLRDFLKVAKKSLYAVTWHQYYFSGRTAELKDFINVTYFDVLPKQIREIKEIVVSTVPKNVQIWLSETSDAYGGGAPGLSDRFVATFLWLDKLGVSARDGVDVVVKQTLVGGHYGLLNGYSLKPHPNWWVSLLFKKLVGTKVLMVYAPLARPEFRIYGHYSAESDHDVVLFGVNFVGRKTKLKMYHNCSEAISMEKYILTAPDDNLASKSILLNGKLLELEWDGSLPTLDPQLEKYDGHLTLPPYSLMFTVLKRCDIDC